MGAVVCPTASGPKIAIPEKQKLDEIVITFTFQKFGTTHALRPKYERVYKEINQVLIASKIYGQQSRGLIGWVVPNSNDSRAKTLLFAKGFWIEGKSFYQFYFFHACDLIACLFIISDWRFSSCCVAFPWHTSKSEGLYSQVRSISDPQWMRLSIGNSTRVPFALLPASTMPIWRLPIAAWLIAHLRRSSSALDPRHWRAPAGDSARHSIR